MDASDEYCNFKRNKRKLTIMRRILIPVDFSETSLNAARFAAQMISGKKDVTVILYHRYEDISEREICINYLESLKKEFLEKGVATVEYEHEMGGDLVENLDRLIQQKTATMIVMGIKGHSSLHDTFFGCTTLKMVERSICPLLIIPPEASFSEIKNVAFASEFKDVESTTPIVFIKSILEMFDPFLHIINVNPEYYISVNESYRQEKGKLAAMFSGFKTEFYFLGINDFNEAIDNFIRDYKIDILVTVPHYHKSVSGLFKTTHTRKLAYHSKVPLLAVHE